MDVLHRRASATARDIHGDLPDAPSYSTVRTLLAVLVKKGHLTTEVSGRSLVYRPARQRKAAAASALRRLVRTFFDGSVANAVSGLLSLREQRLTPEELGKLEQWIADQKPPGAASGTPISTTTTDTSSDSKSGATSSTPPLPPP
jgi:predicted transcriptional regulator